MPLFCAVVADSALSALSRHIPFPMLNSPTISNRYQFQIISGNTLGGEIGMQQIYSFRETFFCISIVMHTKIYATLCVHSCIFAKMALMFIGILLHITNHFLCLRTLLTQRQIDNFIGRRGGDGRDVPWRQGNQQA